jgi:hypothetical protein
MYLDCISYVSGMFRNKRRYIQVTYEIHTSYVPNEFKALEIKIISYLVILCASNNKFSFWE